MNAHRLEWGDIPIDVRGTVVEQLGADVVEATNEAGGFSPSMAARCSLSDGRRVFVKAVSDEPNALSLKMLRHEIAVTSQLSAHFPAPRLLHATTHGNWTVAVFELIDGRPPRTPWDAGELDLVLDAVDALAQLADPSPVDGIAPAVEALKDTFGRWAVLAARGGHPGLDDWSSQHLERLAAVESQWPEAARGEALSHHDIRSDNVVIDRHGRVWFVDWANACTATAPWLDLLFMLPSVALEGGPDPETVWQARPASARADEDAVTTMVVALAGYFTERALAEPPPGLPTVRQFQAAQGVVAREWAAQRTGLRV